MPTTASAQEQRAAAADAAAQVERIRTLDDAGPQLNAVIVYDPEAPAKARAAGGILQGRTVLVKDNIETAEWPTTAGSLASPTTPPAATRR